MGLSLKDKLRTFVVFQPALVSTSKLRSKKICVVLVQVLVLQITVGRGLLVLLRADRNEA